MSTASLVSLPVSTPACPSAHTEDEDEPQGVSSAQTNAPATSVNTPASRGAPYTPVVSAATSALESSTGLPTSDLPPTTTLNDASDSQNATNTASTSRTSQNSAPAKGSHKMATKKTPQPKKMAPLKQLCYGEWKKETQEASDEVFEEHWKNLSHSAKVKYATQAKKLGSNSGQASST
ncbi:hypothetical protein BDM02DRAFT_3191915 [Thelephora ganbajun]|uniref:Uncharacterized protein n=1 Tax=Thelephora ganbajun TaxID=370292 RepID=A0ACB6Z1L1_THEGA|nr:hypothetical protein BDM02DRAFT_3191915 [Thelephora ganbajun]